jgi:hypothetical protein
VKLRIALAATVVAATALTACGTDGASDPSTNSGPEPASTATITPDEPAADGGGNQIEALDAQTICERLAVNSVSADTGLDVVLATPDDSATPQCAFEYTNDTGGISNLTVASMRSEDVGGLAGSDAFDLVVQVNTDIAGDGAEIQDVSAGDAAVRLSGEFLHVGVVQVGNRVLVVSIPVDDVEPDGVDRLIGTMATALG